MWPAEIKCELLNPSYRAIKKSKLLTEKNKSRPLLTKVAAAVYSQKNAFDAAVKAFEIQFKVFTEHKYAYNGVPVDELDEYTLDSLLTRDMTRSVDYARTYVHSQYKNGTDEDRRKLILELEKRGFFQAAHGFDLKDAAQYRLLCVLTSFYMHCVFAVQRAAQGKQTPVPTLRECMLENKGINAVAIGEDGHRHDIDLLDEYKAFLTVNYMVNNGYYGTKDLLVAKLLATRLKELGKEESAHLVYIDEESNMPKTHVSSLYEFKVVLPIDTSTLHSKSASPIYGEVHMDDYYKAAWLRYKNCKKEDANYYLNLMTDEEFYHTGEHAGIISRSH